MSWSESFRRAIGLKPSFRRSGASRVGNILFGSVLGMISGKYIFEEPIKEYWENEANNPKKEGAVSGPASPNTK